MTSVPSSQHTGTATATDPAEPSGKLRVLFLITVLDGAEERFLEAYEQIRHEVARTPGHLGDQVCQSTTEPNRWVITSEWSSAGHFARWERSQAHRTLVAPMRACLTDPVSLRFVVRQETGRSFQTR
jgi:heme oxygenase (mycobilin-producing)